MLDNFTFLCPFCNSEIRVPVAAVGKSGTCKKCRNKVIVPKRVSMPAPTQPTVPVMDPRPFESVKRQSPAVPIGSVLLGSGVFGWAWFAADEVYPLDYAGILIAATGACILLCLVTRFFVALIVASAAFIGGVVWYASNDLVTDNWSNEQIEYSDRVLRFGRIIRTRSMVTHNEAGEKAAQWSGEMSESGKPHGKWHITYFPSYDSRDLWFWYGEEITEGEWHTRTGR